MLQQDQAVSVHTSVYRAPLCTSRCTLLVVNMQFVHKATVSAGGMHKTAACVMQTLQKSVPQDFELMGQRKGFVRYTSAPLQELVKAHAEALQNKEAALAGILQVCFFATSRLYP